MNNFTFWNPTRVVFGKDTVPLIGEQTRAFGQKVMVVSGQGSVKRSGVYDQVLRSLAEANLEVVEFPGVKSNPVLTHLRQGIVLARHQNVEAIVAVGGGSVIDEAKAVAAGAIADADVWDFFVDRAKIERALPIATVLTLAATGSEMNCGAVITNEESRQKFNITSPHLYPQVSILDPTVTFTVPRDYTAYAAVDAIAHVIEGYFTSADSATPLQDRLVEGLILTIMEATETILGAPENYDARATMMWAASLALNGLTTAGIGLYGFPNHMLEHSLSALYDIPHGAGLSIVMPGWMTYASKQHPVKFARFAERVFGITRSSTAEAAAAGIDALRQWFDRIGSPTSLAAAHIPGEHIDRIAENASMLATKWRLKTYTKETIAEILRLCQ
ncbi:MAG TPA: NADH-dependent alcohol dehydrogenase [Syntrophobacteraceae bacterium]|nr:NADH-dependent alcohol dehydrogenase [Syntrophobacteraceae bacterium]